MIARLRPVAMKLGDEFTRCRISILRSMPGLTGCPECPGCPEPRHAEYSDHTDTDQDMCETKKRVDHKMGVI